MDGTESPMRKSDKPIEPVRKNRTVNLPPDKAFELFTSRMGEWWPLLSHSIGAANAVGIRFEGRVGGRVVELTSEGNEFAWADILAWDPPHRFVLAWHPSEEPVAASVLEVRFEASGLGTELHLEHRGWEEFGSTEGTAMRDQYGPGWDSVLDPFLASVLGISEV